LATVLLNIALDFSSSASRFCSVLILDDIDHIPFDNLVLASEESAQESHHSLVQLDVGMMDALLSCRKVNFFLNNLRSSIQTDHTAIYQSEY